MTKVNLTVTKQLDQVPEEVEKQLGEVAQKVEDLLRKTKSIEQGFSLGLPLDKTAHSMMEMVSLISPIQDMYQDIANICHSFDKIEKENENLEKKSALESSVKSAVAEFKFQSEAKIGQLMATNKLLNEQIANFVKKEEISQLIPPKPQSSKKSTNKKTTRKK